MHIRLEVRSPWQLNIEKANHNEIGYTSYPVANASGGGDSAATVAAKRQLPTIPRSPESEPVAAVVKLFVSCQATEQGCISDEGRILRFGAASVLVLRRLSSARSDAWRGSLG